MHGVYIGNGRMLVQPAFGGYLFVPSDEMNSMPELVTTGLYEAPLTKFLIKTVKPGQLVFDVGGNVGYFSVLLSRLVGGNGQVVVYEPNPRLQPFIRDNFAVNHLRSLLVPKAAYSESTTLTFHVAKRESGFSSIYKRDDVAEWETIEVEAEPLDVHAAKVQRIDLVKMDIEGAEYHAFVGMQRLFEQGKIGTVVFEWNRLTNPEDAARLVEILAKLEREQLMGFYLLNEAGETVPTPLAEVVKALWHPAVVMRRKGTL